MTVNVQELIELGDEQKFDEAFFDGQCKNFFLVDWREYDEEIVAICEGVIETGKLSADINGNTLVIHYGEKESRVELPDSAGARHVTVCTLNDLLDPDYQIRFIVASHGSDTMGFCALRKAQWEELDKRFPYFLESNFIDPRLLPNIVTELTDDKLPAKARVRYERMLAGYSR